MRNRGMNNRNIRSCLMMTWKIARDLYMAGISSWLPNNYNNWIPRNFPYEFPCRQNEQLLDDLHPAPLDRRHNGRN